MNQEFIIRNAKEEEFKNIGGLMVQVYSALEGFPKINDQPEYYEVLKNVGDLTKNSNTELIVAVSEQGKIGGAVVYFRDLKDYGSGGSISLENEKNASGFRLLAVDPETRGMGIGKKLILECIQRSEASNFEQIIIHSTKTMHTAWKMHEKLGFKRSEELDFMLGDLGVFGFRYIL
ncbi:GNAT family N-acetyltransferase [Aquimarina spongiae]|uniref:Acetyltransferase (GNAT) family protein n=1 Tax=Aquimarina spongiae TaxID=570521 RepID=A0A1M6I0X7_9FLAO|nr:GNAT family N-acetyltransferase [Aquimarina spongiae]SHJ28087.1 Acetyltransferase (GNAT) family protein [Aquimarina spongiae]